MKSTEVEFWDTRYRAAATPWDFGGVPAALTEYLRTAPPRRALIPGCGPGYEIRAFHEHGWDVLALDYSPAAVERARQVLGGLADEIVVANFFEHDLKGKGFDVIYERTFLCSQPPEVWARQVRRMADLLVPSGQLIGFFFYGHEEDPPPYPMTGEQAQELFREHFVRVEDQPASDSLPIFAGRERWQIWQRNNVPIVRTNS